MKHFLYTCAVMALFFSCSSTDSATYSNMLADVDPFSVGAVNAAMDQTFSSKVKALEAEVVFYPRDNEVALEFSYNLGYYQQFWNEAGRDHFIAALNQYKEDYTSRNLSNNSKKSQAIYGKANDRLLWKTLAISATYSSSPLVEFGYRFKDGSPYFTIYQRSGKEETGSNRSISKSPYFPLYFTIAQAEELAQLFDQAYLVGTLGVIKSGVSSDPDRDAY